MLYYLVVIGVLPRSSLGNIWSIFCVSRSREKYLKWDQVFQKKSIKNTKFYTLFFRFATVKAIARIYVQNFMEKLHNGLQNIKGNTL